VEKITNEASDGGGLFSSVADPGSCAFLTPRSGMEKNPDPVSGMNIPDYFFESLETVVRGKNT
jgi:hypothetical protein